MQYGHNTKAAYQGRGAGFNPNNRFEKLHLETDPDFMDENTTNLQTEYYLDNTRKILAKNDSPDVAFDYSINPYRGCEHGCIYCYARPTHEYFGLSAGLDFESKIIVKKEAPELSTESLKSILSLAADVFQREHVASNCTVLIRRGNGETLAKSRYRRGKVITNIY